MLFLLQRRFAKALSLVALSFLPAISSASLISGFETGLSGWDSLGDVSVQSSIIGTAPTQGSQQAFLTTLCDSSQVSWCETISRELPFSGISSAPSVSRHNGAVETAASFLGLPTDMLGFEQELPGARAMMGEGGALRTRFHATAGSLLSFDWNHIALGATPTGAREADASYFTLWSDDALDSFRYSDFLSAGGDRNQIALNSNVNLCSRVMDRTCAVTASYETGYNTRSITLDHDGWFWLGFGMGEIAEGTVPSALVIDNVRLTSVAEPNTLALASLSLLPLLAVRRRKFLL